MINHVFSRLESLPQVTRNAMCNYGADTMALDVGRFDDLGAGIVPERPKVFARRRVP